MFLCDNTLNVDKIVWSRWEIDGATGRGIEFRDDCVPNCAQGSAIYSPAYSPAIVTLSDAAPPDFHFTSATIKNLTTGGSQTLALGFG
jgi:hypothetical protein